jgi:hypothetical protein
MPGKQIKARADEMLERMGLSDAASRVVRTYSDGMKRKLNVALGLMHRPRCYSWMSRQPVWILKRELGFDLAPVGGTSGSYDRLHLALDIGVSELPEVYIGKVPPCQPRRRHIRYSGPRAT